MEDFNKIIIQTLADQLVRGYQIRDDYGNYITKESPLQSILATYINQNRDEIIKIVALQFQNTEILKEAISDKINSDMKSDWMRKSYEEKFLGNIKQKLEEEVVKDLRVLLDGKKITIEINSDSNHGNDTKV